MPLKKLKGVFGGKQQPVPPPNNSESGNNPVSNGTLPNTGIPGFRPGPVPTMTPAGQSPWTQNETGQRQEGYAGAGQQTNRPQYLAPYAAPPIPHQNSQYVYIYPHQPGPPPPAPPAPPPFTHPNLGPGPNPVFPQRSLPIHSAPGTSHAGPYLPAQPPQGPPRPPPSPWFSPPLLPPSSSPSPSPPSPPSPPPEPVPSLRLAGESTIIIVQRGHRKVRSPHSEADSASDTDSERSRSESENSALWEYDDYGPSRFRTGEATDRPAPPASVGSGKAAVNHNRRYEHMPAAMVPHWYIRLWSVIPEPSSERAKDALCTNCRHIDIRALFRQPATTVMPLARDFIALGRLESILQEGIAGCKLCALALRVILIDATSDLPPSTTADERLAKKREKLNALLKETYYVCPIKFKAQPPAPILYLCSRSDVAEMVAKRTRPRYTMGFRPMHQSCPSHGRALRNPGTIDFEWIRKTLRMCDERDVGKLDYRHAVPVRAIDVDAMCIADVADGQRYVTLSYVWGANVQQLRLTKSAEQTFRQPGGLQDFLGQIPQTIQDAIALTRAIGERYLWVDVLCIVQDDDADLQHSIGEMGSIYRNSILTICACCGDDASYGLPGVRPGTRTATDQTCSAVGQCLGLSNVIGDSADAAEEGCTWATRGWTMQEKVLSQRKLEITDRSVRWWCWHAVASEDENCQHPHWDIGEEHRTMYFFKTEHEQVVSKITGKKCNMDTYAFMVADYTGRSLTHHGDAEMAFRGVLKQIQYSFRGTFLAGLPDTELSAALLWVPLGKQQRRRDATTGRDLFPSWSWLGWSGKASYPWLVERSMPMSEAGCPLEWRRQTWRQGDHDEWFTGLEYRLNGSSDPNWREKTRGKPPRWRIHESDGWCSTEDDEEGSGWLHPVEVAFPSSSTRANQYTGHATNARDIRTLRLRTLSACFHLEGTFRRRKDNHDHLHAVYQMRVLDPKGFSVGYIYTPDPSTMTVEGQSQFGGGGPREFIALSRASTNPDPRFGRDLLYTTPISELSSVYSTWDPGNDSSAGHENSEDVDDIAHFNTRLFDPELPWGLFNVMMISREGEVAKRVAIGRIHVAAFMGGLPLLKEITLE